MLEIAELLSGSPAPAPIAVRALASAGAKAPVRGVIAPPEPEHLGFAPSDMPLSARVVAFNPACNEDTRALALSAVMCAEIQRLEDLNVHLDFGD